MCNFFFFHNTRTTLSQYHIYAKCHERCYSQKKDETAPKMQIYTVHRLVNQNAIFSISWEIKHLNCNRYRPVNFIVLIFAEDPTITTGMKRTTFAEGLASRILHREFRWTATQKGNHTNCNIDMANYCMVVDRMGYIQLSNKLKH